MWAALHWVKHDKAGEIDMELIFDQKRPLPHGIVDGGMGKSEMYKSEQKSFTMLNSPASRSTLYSGACGSFSLNTTSSGGQPLALVGGWD